MIPAMDLLHYTSQSSTLRFFRPHYCSSKSLSRRFFTVRSSLPFPNQKGKYHKELEAAVDVVERACRLCVDVKKSLFSGTGRILEKNDQTPVTVADFGVQALVSLELNKLFPSIPLVAEEDSAFLRSNNLVDSVVLDPIDGTKGFLKGSEALYVVGLALVVEGEIVLGVMGCPNWKEKLPYKSTAEVQENENILAGPGVIMVAHVGCGTWKKELSGMLDNSANTSDCWTRCFVVSCCSVHEAYLCIPESQTWHSLPLSALFSATTDTDSVGDNEIVLLPQCCGSLCKYLMVASGKASVFILRARAQTVIKAWDHAVGVICVHEAGGKVSDWKGIQLDFAADVAERRIIFPSVGILVSNGNVHNQILEMISSTSSIV